MTKRKILFLILLFSGLFANAQQKWDLKRSVEYALANNISVKQADVQARLAELTHKQSKLSQIPSLNFGGNMGYSSGRNQDPTSFGLTTLGFLTSGYTLQAGADLFNWFSKRNTIEGNELEAQASRAGVDKLKNDIALNVAAAYLQALLSAEQANVTAVQIKQTQAQLDNTRKLVAAGSLPELNAAELDAQLARDSSTFVTAQAATIQAILQLKALLNVDAAQPFEVEAPPVESIPVESLADLQPAAVYALALQNLPQQKVNELRLQSARKFVEAARGAMYPSFSVFGSLGSTYNNQSQEITGTTIVNAPIGKVTIGSTDYAVFPSTPFTNFSYGKTRYFNQIDQNFRQSIGLSVNVPILGGGTLKSAYNRSKLNLQTVELQKEQDNQTLKQDIYRAYSEATAALQKFNASGKSVETAQKAHDFALKRFNIDLLNTIDLITIQNNLFRAKIDLISAQFDYVFKLKVLEFYKGQGLKL